MSVHSLCICSKSACIPANIPTKTEYTLTEKKKYPRTLPDTHGIGFVSIFPAQFADFGYSFIELTLYAWLALSSFFATITRLCQEVPVLTVQAFTTFSRNSARP